MARTTIRTEDITASEVTTAKMATDPTNASNLSSGSVPAAQLGNVDLTGLEDDIALLGFRVASNGSLAKYNLVDQTVDDFQDTSGVDASASTAEARNDAGNYYYGEAAVSPTVSGNYDTTGTDGDYSWYKWTTVRSDGSYTTNTAQDYEYLVVAGGAGGGHASSNSAGGGGAGGYRTATGFAVAATTIGSITVGAGGAAGSNTVGSSGSNSVFSTITSAGGGGGAAQEVAVVGIAGGSGGGGCYNEGLGGAGNTPSTSPVQGYAGGRALADGGHAAGGGGGGAGAVGEDGSQNGAGAHEAGDGGVGRTSSIDGSATFRGGGGAGEAYELGVAVGGNGGGGNSGAAGTANTGGGGGAGSTGGTSRTAGAGGSGIVIIRRLTSSNEEGGDMSLVSTTTAAQAVPTKGDIVLTYTNGAGSTTLDTDLTAEISADGGSTWTALALGSEGSTGSHNIATSHDVTISSTITSPWNMAYRIKTLNQSASKTTRIQAVSLGWS